MAFRFMASDPNKLDGKDDDCNHGYEPPAWMPEHWIRRFDNKKWTLEFNREPAATELLKHHNGALEQIAACLEEKQIPVAWVEVGTFGFWGEWHHDEGVPRKKQIAANPPANRKAQIIQQYMSVFEGSPLVINFDAFAKDEQRDHNHELLKIVIGMTDDIGIRYDDLGRGDKYFGEVLKEIEATVQSVLGEGTSIHDAFQGRWGGEMQPKTINRAARASRRSAILELVDLYRFTFVTESGFDELHGENANLRNAMQAIDIALQENYEEQ